MGKRRYEMVGYAKRTLMCVMGKNGNFYVEQHKSNQVIIEKDNYAVMDNVCYPFQYFDALQSCDEKQYRSLSGDS